MEMKISMLIVETTEICPCRFVGILLEPSSKILG